MLVSLAQRAGTATRAIGSQPRSGCLPRGVAPPQASSLNVAIDSSAVWPR